MESSTDDITTKQWFEIIEQPNPVVQLITSGNDEEPNTGAIFGKNCGDDDISFMKIRIFGYVGPVIIIISCISNDEPFSPHPHKLIGSNCKDGICTLVDIDASDFKMIEIRNLYIKYVHSIPDIHNSLFMRKMLSVDPYSTGFNGIDAITLNTFRLAIQVILPAENGNFSRILIPKHTNSIHFNTITDPTEIGVPKSEGNIVEIKKRQISQKNNLHIYHLSYSSSVASGGQRIMLLCSRFEKTDDVCIRLFQYNNDGEIIWERFVMIERKNIFNKIGISFLTPPYKNVRISNVQQISIQLYRSSDGATSESIPFDYYPCALEIIQHKRNSLLEGSRKFLFNQIQNQLLTNVNLTKTN